MVVQHNMPALNANRYLGINNNNLSKSLEKLSSGYQINRAGDNAAGLAVSEKMRAQISGVKQAVKNCEDGISMVQTYEGALTETHNILNKMKTLATQASNGIYDNDVDRAAVQLEFDQLANELDQIADTDFNGIIALNGGVMADGTTYDAQTNKFGYKCNGTNISSSTKANSGITGDVSVSNAYSASDTTLIYVSSIVLQAGGRGKDSVNFTFDYSKYSAGFSGGTHSLTADMNVTSFGLGLRTQASGGSFLQLSSQAEANCAIDQIDFAINKVSMVRATFGAIQNRLEHKIDNLNVTEENLTSAESRIRDTDMAKEMMALSKNQILAQASQSMLAQANSLPQGVLSLLQ